MREKLVERGVKQSYRHRLSVHHFEDLIEILVLHCFELAQRRGTLLLRFRDNHFTKDVDPLLIKEHVFRSAKPYSFGSEFQGQRGVGGFVGVCPHVKTTDVFLHDVDIIEKPGFPGIRFYEPGNSEIDCRLTVLRNTHRYEIALRQISPAHGGLFSSYLEIRLHQRDFAVLPRYHRSVGGIPAFR